jgi:hypothetical protein
MLKAFRVSLLVFTLTCSVFAGEMPNGVQPPPPPLTTKSIVEETGNSIIIQEPQEITTTTAEITLDLMQLVLGLF